MKYFRTFLLGLEAEFASRVNILGWFLTGLIPSITLVIVWFAILGNRPSVNGFTKGDFILYYLFVTAGWYIVGGTFGRTTGTEIKEGKITTTLLKPYDVVLGQALQEQAWKVISLGISLPITLLILFLFRDLINIQLSYTKILLLIISLLLGGINFALVEGIVGISAFWFTEIWPVDHVKNICLELFGGLLVPLSLMPPVIYSIANVLPFKYMFYVPVSLLLSKSKSPLIDVAIQALYVIILFAVYKLIWTFGIKKYEGVGA